MKKRKRKIAINQGENTPDEETVKINQNINTWENIGNVIITMPEYINMYII